MDIKRLIELAQDLYSKKTSLLSLQQEIAEHFSPIRADFTLKRPLGTDFAAGLMTSYPVQCARTLGDQFATMLRPTARPWFHVGMRHVEQVRDNETRRYLEWFEQVQRRAMYDPASQFTRATKEGDHDFAVFGQCAISVEMNQHQDALLYRTWHLRDMVWSENEDGQISFVARKDKPSALNLVRKFGKDKVHKEVLDAFERSPFDEVECMHLVVDADMYDGRAEGRPRWSLWYDLTHCHLLEAVPIWNRHYRIPRWCTMSSTLFGSQYAYSPAVVCALPDARLIQAMTFTLLEAGEKATSPPMLATKNAIRSDLALYAGGVTWVDMDYDERLGEALRPITQDFRGFNFGVQMNAETRNLIAQAFFLDKLQIPQRAPEMTAYEVGQRVQEYVRNALPIFEPMEMDYNAGLCEETFDILRRRGAFGPEDAWPRSLQGAEIAFNFESPLHDAIEQQKGQKYQEAQQLIGQAIALDPSCAFVPRAEVALREALAGIGVPSVWLNSEAEVSQSKAQQAAQQAAMQKLAAMEQGSNIAKNLGQSGMLPQQQMAVA